MLIAESKQMFLEKNQFEFPQKNYQLQFLVFSASQKSNAKTNIHVLGILSFIGLRLSTETWIDEMQLVNLH